MEESGSLRCTLEFEERYGGGNEEMLQPLLSISVSLGSGNISVMVIVSSFDVRGGLSQGTSSTIGGDLRVIGGETSVGTSSGEEEGSSEQDAEGRSEVLDRFAVR